MPPLARALPVTGPVEGINREAVFVKHFYQFPVAPAVFPEAVNQDDPAPLRSSKLGPVNLHNQASSQSLLGEPLGVAIRSLGPTLRRTLTKVSPSITWTLTDKRLARKQENQEEKGFSLSFSLTKFTTCSTSPLMVSMSGFMKT